MCNYSFGVPSLTSHPKLEGAQEPEVSGANPVLHHEKPGSQVTLARQHGSSVL